MATLLYRLSGVPSFLRSTAVLVAGFVIHTTLAAVFGFAETTFIFMSVIFAGFCFALCVIVAALNKINARQHVKFFSF